MTCQLILCGGLQLTTAGQLTGSPLTRPTSTLCCWSSSWNSGTTRLSERTERRWARNWECSLHKPVISNPYSFHLRLSNLIHTSAHLTVWSSVNILRSIFFSVAQMKESHTDLDQNEDQYMMTDFYFRLNIPIKVRQSWTTVPYYFCLLIFYM